MGRSGDGNETFYGDGLYYENEDPGKRRPKTPGLRFHSTETTTLY